MYELDQQYQDRLKVLGEEVQASEELEQYLEEEEEEFYLRLKEMFEPKIAAIYEEVAENDPLQLVAFESALLDETFEGLYLPKILGFSVLRGEVNEIYKYVRPQDHFKSVLMAICNSANFDILKKRIGQSIQMGFAMSSDIWITNLINAYTNKRIRYYLQGQILDKYRQPQSRSIGLTRYGRQFKNDNFQSAEFPTTPGGLKVLFSPLKNFLIHRINRNGNNASLVEPLKTFIANESLHGSSEHAQIMGLFAAFFPLGKEEAFISKYFNQVRKDTPEFDSEFLEFILELLKRDDVGLHGAAELQLASVADKTMKDSLSDYFTLTDQIHKDGYINEEVQQAVKVFYNQHEGRSLVNECVREVIFGYFSRLINNLEPRGYSDFFEAAKLFPVYMGIFVNQQFNQDLKDLSMKYIRKLLKIFVDKRGKDYQDIKKFVSSTFVEYGFLKEKEVVELFKTRRKRTKTEA